MNKYEMLTIFSASLSDEQKDAAVNKYVELIEKDGGKVTGLNKMGVKKLAYAINYKTEGYYVLFNFEADQAVPAKIANLMNIDEAVMRQLCLRQDA